MSVASVAIIRLLLFSTKIMMTIPRSTMLAGLWGAHNYMDMAMAKKVKAKTTAWYQTNLTTDSDNKVKSALLDVQPNLFKFYDQRVFARILQGEPFLTRWRDYFTLSERAWMDALPRSGPSPPLAVLNGLDPARGLLIWAPGSTFFNIDHMYRAA